MRPLYLEAFEDNYKTKTKTIKIEEDPEDVLSYRTHVAPSQQCATVYVMS